MPADGRPKQAAPRANPSWIVSLAFWVSLLFSATLYGVVYLAPRWHTHLLLEQAVREKSAQLQAYEARNRKVKGIVEALRNDSDFALELARNAFRTPSAGEERFATDEALSLDRSLSDVSVTASPPDDVWYLPVLRVVATHGPTSRLLLTLAAVTIVFAFAVLPAHRDE